MLKAFDVAFALFPPMAESLSPLHYRMCVSSVLCHTELSFWHSCEVVLKRHSQQMPWRPLLRALSGTLKWGESLLLSWGSCGELCSIARFSLFVSCSSLQEGRLLLQVKEAGAGAGENPSVVLVSMKKERALLEGTADRAQLKDRSQIF